MVQYVNGFSCALDSEKEDLIINFVQRIPVIEEDGILEEAQVENVASVVMGKIVAEKLLDVLKEILDDDMDADEK